MQDQDLYKTQRITNYSTKAFKNCRKLELIIICFLLSFKQ